MVFTPASERFPVTWITSLVELEISTRFVAPPLSVRLFANVSNPTLTPALRVEPLPAVTLPTMEPLPASVWPAPSAKLTAETSNVAPLATEIEGLAAEHSLFHSRELVGFTDFSDEERSAYPPTPRPVVRLHPGSMRKSLYLASHASHIVGLPVEEGRALLARLTDFATQPKFVYVHHWQLHDLVVWDNRCTMHRGRPYDDIRYRRDMRRTTVADAVSIPRQDGSVQS